MAKRTGRRLTLIQQSRRVPPSDKAEFHNELGAGKRHVIRHFFGLNEQDVHAIEARLAKGLDEAVA